jgi:predicted nucleic acid-binding protein
VIVLVDTPVWSVALRRKHRDLNAQEQRLTQVLRELIHEGRARLLGPIRQELLSGIREEERFQKLRLYLHAFDDPNLAPKDYEEAARMSTQCRSRGIAGSAIDFLLCAAAYHRHWQIFTTDRDFGHYAKVLPLNLYSSKAE